MVFGFIAVARRFCVKNGCIEVASKNTFFFTASIFFRTHGIESLFAQGMNKRQKPRKRYFAAAGSTFYVLLLAGNVAIVGVLDLTWAQRYVVFCFSKILRSIFFEYSYSECRIVCFCLAAGVSLARQKFGLG